MRLLSTLCLSAALAAPISGLADTNGPNILSQGGAAPGGARIFAIAQDLYQIGLANKDALTVLTAARLAGSVALQEGGELKKETTGTAQETANADAQDSAPPSVADMLNQAKILAGEDDLLLSLIDDAEVEGTRGRVGGAIQRLSRLPGGLTDVWEVPFYGSAQSEIAIIGDGDSNLDVQIADANGHTICVDLSASDKMMCDFVPAENGYFYVTVQNKGEEKNSYYLLTN
ncbi:hypothetical protein ACSBLW_15375 [Thioclava sp. FR2]|uniref:hypothetical protein n=1 Tax=Thioclava sp. FR2 TaxID=3445780 RepID=UPI003EBEB363